MGLPFALPITHWFLQHYERLKTASINFRIIDCKHSLDEFNIVEEL